MTSPPDKEADVSVVIPCYRCADTMDRAVQSVANQTLRLLELILVDDASGDGTLEHLREIQLHYGEGWIKVLSLLENVGAGGARNAGWDIARGQYIAFLDADDEWHPKKLEIQYGWMADHPEVSLTGHSLVRLEEGGPFPQVQGTLEARRITRKRLLISNRFQTSSVMLRRDVPFRFDASRRFLEDYPLWLEIVLRGNPAYRFDAGLAAQHKAIFGESGLSAQLWNMEKGELAAYRRVFREGLINLPTLALATTLSLIKFVRRVAITQIRGSASKAVKVTDRV